MFVTAPSVIFLEGKKEGGNSVHKNGLLFFSLIWDAIFFFHMAPNHFLPPVRLNIYPGVLLWALEQQQSVLALASTLSYCEKTKPNQTKLQTVKPEKVKELEEFKGLSFLLSCTSYWIPFEQCITYILMRPKQTP